MTQRKQMTIIHAVEILVIAFVIAWVLNYKTKPIPVYSIPEINVIDVNDTIEEMYLLQEEQAAQQSVDIEIMRKL